jgi:hypothetical protein
MFEKLRLEGLPVRSSVQDEFPVLAERHLRLRESVHTRPVELVIQIGYPYWTRPDIEAACPVAVRGAVGRVNDIRGIDPMGAVAQAIKFIETYLQDASESGRLFWPDGEAYSTNR